MIILGGNWDTIDATPQFARGTIAMDSDTHKRYRYVQYHVGSGSVPAQAGSACYYLATTGLAASNVTCDVSDSDAAAVGAGILQAVIPDTQYGWIQVKGHATCLAGTILAGTNGQALTAEGAGDYQLDVSALVSDKRVGHIVNSATDEIHCDFPE